MTFGAAVLAVLLFFTGCAPKPAAVKKDYDFSKIRRVAVVGFKGQGGPAVANEFVRQLLASGLEVTDRPQGVDAVLAGAVTQYKPGDKLMIFLGDTQTLTPNGQTVVVTNPVVSLSGSQVTPQGSALGLPNTQIVSVNATVGVIARLTDSGTGTVVWADDYSYEGLDIQSALQSVVRSLVKSLRRTMVADKK